MTFILGLFIMVKQDGYMKKLLLILALILSFIMPSFAECNYSPFCPPYAYDLSSPKGQKISKKLGVTSLAEKIVEKRIEYELKKTVKQKFDVSVKSYSFLDLIQGRFKSITITGKDLNIEGAHLSFLELKTVCDFNYVDWGKNPIRFKENLIMGFSTEISNADLKKTMESSGYLDKLNCVNVKGCGITFFKLSGADIKIKNNKMYFKVRVTSQLLLDKPLDIALATDLKAENGRIVMTKVNLGNLPHKIDLSNVANRLGAMNPLAFSLDVFENKKTKLCIQSVKIVGDEIFIGGNVFIPKNSG